MKQTVEVPAECPECGGPVCVTDLSPPSGIAHCHNRRDDTECGWRQSFPIDPDSTGLTIVSRELDD